MLSVLVTSGWMWLRDSSFVAVRDVQITGVTASDGDRVRAALQNAAQEMTTLHVREQALREATASFTSVEDLRVKTDFPHAMTIEVIERQPVAALAGGRGERRIPVTGSGVLLRGVTAERDLPSLVLRQTAVGPKLTDRRALRALTIASAAPDPLLQPRERARRSGHAGLSSRSRMAPNWCSVPTRTRARSGARRRACWPRPRPRAPPISTSGFPVGWPLEGSRRSRPRRRTRTLNLRLRIAQLSTRDRDFGDLQRSLRRFAPVDIGNEIPVPCGNPPGHRAC